MGRRLDALEERLGVKLLVRTTRRITLTHEGSAFLEDCQRLLADLANAEASVSAGGVKASGHLRITAPAGFGRRHVAPLVPKFRELHADVTISLNLSDRVVDLAGEGFDCAVRVGRPARLVAGERAPGRQPAPVRGHAGATWSSHGTPAASQRPGDVRLPHPVQRRIADPGLGVPRAQGRRLSEVDASQSARRPAGLLGRPGAARLVPGRLRHRLAQHLGGRGRHRRRPAGRSAGRFRRAAQRHLRASFRSASTCRCGCGCGSTSSSTTTASPSSGKPEAMTLEALLAYAHLLAILTLVVFISSEAALVPAANGSMPRSWSGWSP